MTFPLVSVCIPTYQYGRFLSQAIDSVLGQTLKEFELLVYDDASTDNTRQVLESYGARDQRIRWKVHPRNRGMVENWNACLSDARGEFVKFLMADDYLLTSNALEALAARLQKNPSAALAGCARQLVRENGAPLKIWGYDTKDSSHGGADVIRRCLLLRQNLIGEPTAVMFRRAQAGRGFDTRYRQSVDQEMWFHLLTRGDYEYIAQPLCAFRQHEQQQTKQNARERVHLLDDQLMLEQYLKMPALSLSPRAQWWLRYLHVRDCKRWGFAPVVERYGRLRYWRERPRYYYYKHFLRSRLRAEAGA